MSGISPLAAHWYTNSKGGQFAPPFREFWVALLHFLHFGNFFRNSDNLTNNGSQLYQEGKSTVLGQRRSAITLQNLTPYRLQFLKLIFKVVSIFYYIYNIYIIYIVIYNIAINDSNFKKKNNCNL